MASFHEHGSISSWPSHLNVLAMIANQVTLAQFNVKLPGWLQKEARVLFAVIASAGVGPMSRPEMMRVVIESIYLSSTFLEELPHGLVQAD